MRRAILFLGCAGVVGVGLSGGCSASKDEPAPAGGGAGQDSGVICPSTLAVDPSPDLTGRWAWKTVASLLMPKTGLTAEFHTRTVSFLLVDQTQTGTNVMMRAQYCSRYAEEDPGAISHVTIPDAYVRSLVGFTRTGTYATQGDAGPSALTLPTFAEVQGAHLADPMNDALPALGDSRVFDQDADGNPGITIKISSMIVGDLYVVQREKSQLAGVATGVDRVEGLYQFTSEQAILDSNSALLKATASSQVAVPDANACASTFIMVRVAPAATCTDVTAALFQ
jgi:hypothetical protein